MAPTASYAADGNFDGPTAFASNAVAMITDGPWLEGEVPKGLDYGVAPYPAGSTGRSTNIGIGVAALLKTTPAEDQAGLAFIKFLASPAQGAYLASQSGGLPSSPAQIGQPVLKQAGVNPVVQRLRQQLEVRATPSPQPAVVHRFVVPLHRDQRRHRREGHASPGALHCRPRGRPGARPERLVLGVSTSTSWRGGCTPPVPASRLTWEGTVG